MEILDKNTGNNNININSWSYFFDFLGVSSLSPRTELGKKELSQSNRRLFKGPPSPHLS